MKLVALMSLTSLTMTIFSLLAVAFITLLERKILGFMQIRLGPNKVSTTGILQPLSDAIKLYTKEINWPNLSNSTMFFISPCLSLTLSLFLWLTMPYFFNSMNVNTSMLLLLSIMGLGVYPIILAGWSSNSNYSLLGSMRALAQTISYEVSLIFIFLSNLFIISSINFKFFILYQKEFMFLMFLSSFMLWSISTLAEVNRTPFDFAEGESELVSGFNTEYSSGKFAIIFMAEYMMILFFSVLTTIQFNFFPNSIFLMIFTSIYIFSFIWVRATLPRYRYDKLMNLCWKFILPFVTFYLPFSILLTSIF